MRAAFWPFQIVDLLTQKWMSVNERTAQPLVKPMSILPRV